MNVLPFKGKKGLPKILTRISYRLLILEGIFWDFYYSLFINGGSSHLSSAKAFLPCFGGKCHFSSDSLQSSRVTKIYYVSLQFVVPNYGNKNCCV